jgi:putative ABC transport system substrate-binding protein
MMKRREFITLLGSATATWPLAARAHPDRVRRIGVLMAVAESDPDVQRGLVAFRQSLGELGWREGSNLRFEYRWGAADPDRIRTYARELVELSPDIILAHSTPPVVALLRETRSIPIVFLTVTDPLGQGLVKSLAHPGGNITGFSVFMISLGSKWLEVLKEIAPRTTRATIIFNPQTAPYYALYLRSIEVAAPSFSIEPVAVQIHNDADIERAITTVGRERNGGLIILPDSFNVVHRGVIIDLVARYRLPAVYYFRYFAADGGLISYGPDEIDLFRRAAGYVDRILKGANPADLPVQQPSRFEMVINLKTAKALGITIPHSLLVRADEVIQ